MAKKRIALFANDYVGLEVTKFLVAQGEQIVKLYIHPPEKQKLTAEIIAAAGLDAKDIVMATETHQPENIEKLAAAAPDFIITIYWSYILKPALYQLARQGTINFHPAYLPINRGEYPHVHSMINNQPTGVTLHALEEKADVGPIWVQKKVPILATDTALDIYQRLQQEIIQLFKDNWDKIKAGAIRPFPQDESMATFHRKNEIDQLDEIKLDETVKAGDLINKLRARTFGKKGFAYFVDREGEKVFLNLKLGKVGDFPNEMLNKLDFLTNKAKEIRKKSVEMVFKANASHIGGALSIADILTVLYYKILRIDPTDPGNPQRDKFILSKGHSCTALYAILADRGFFDSKILESYGVDGSCLPGHATRQCVPGVEASTGSLGHGLPMAVGFALADSYDKNNFRTFVLLGDGECNEGSIWEAAMFAAKHKLENLTVIVDFNGWQAFGRTAEVTGLLPLKEKWQAFGWAVREVDGHNISDLISVFERLPLETGKPTVIIAKTIKGKGVSFMEDKLEWHYKSPTAEEYEQAMRELS